MFRAAFLDRDGTIARDVHYCSRPEDFEILPGVPEAIRLLNESGFKVVVVTNQSGLARGYFDEATLSLIHRKMTDELARSNARVDAIYHCPHHPGDGCDCRKPRTALFQRAARDLGIDLKQSFVIGDTDMDVKAGKSVGAATILVATGPDGGSKASGESDFVAPNLLSAARLVVAKTAPVASVIVPAYNEERGLPLVLSKIFDVVDSKFEVIVVDDGSVDRTSDVAASYPCRVVRHPVNLGKGEAILTGARNAGSDNLVYIDADDTYPAAAIPGIAESLMRYDMVIGSRKHGQENIPPFNRMGNLLFRNMIKKLYGFKPYDPLTGLWGIRRQYLFVCKPTVRFAPDAQVCMKAARIGLEMLDVPIRYSPRVGKTKLPPLKAGFEHLRLILSLTRWTPTSNEDDGIQAEDESQVFARGVRTEGTDQANRVRNA